MDGENKNQGTWTDLLTLVRLCPARVPVVCDTKGRRIETVDGSTVPITGATRLMLLILTLHANAERGDQAYPSLETLVTETRCDPRTVDRALAGLTRAGLITSRQAHHPDGSWSVSVRTVNRALLQALVGEPVKDDGLHQALAEMQTSGEGLVQVKDARKEQTKHRLYALAGDQRIRIDEQAAGGDYCFLVVRPAAFVPDEVSSDEAIEETGLDATMTSVKPSSPQTEDGDSIETLSAKLRNLKHVGARLSRKDADRLAHTLIDTYDDSEGSWIDDLPEATLIRASNPELVKNPGGYLLTCIKKEFGACVESEWPDTVAELKEWPGLWFGDTPLSHLEQLRKEYIRLAGDEYVVGEFTHERPDWVDDSDESFMCWLPITRVRKN